MKKIYFLLIALIISNASFASGWVETFNGNINVFAVDDETAPAPPDDAWYFTGITTVNFLGMKSVQSAWKTDPNWNFGNELKPAAASFAYFNGSLVLSGATSNEFSLVSPKFRPAPGASTLYYEVQEIKVWPFDNPKTGEQIFLEVGAKAANGEWVWTSSSANILAGLTGYNSATTSITVLQADLSDYIGKDIKIRFRGLTDQGAFAAILTKVALIDNSSANFSVSTLKDIPALIPVKHIAGIVKATIVNQSKALASGEVSAKVTSIPAEYEATASVPALATFDSKEITFTTPFAPKSFKEYALQYLFTTPGISNSVTSAPFTATPNTFASDNGYLSAYVSSNIPFGKKFTLTETDNIESVSVSWAKYTSEPASYNFKIIIYKVAGATAESVFESETFTRPTMAQTPPNGRTATFTDYVFPTPVALTAGDYIFALAPVSELHVGADYTNLSPSYKVNPETNAVIADIYNNYLIRVNTGSDITLIPASNFAMADVNAPVKVLFKNPGGIKGINTAGIRIYDREGNPGKQFNITYDAGVLTIRHTTLDYNTRYTVVIPEGCVIGYGKPISWTFTTVGTINPKTYSPANFGSNVALDAPISVQFDRAIPANSSKAGITIVKNDASQEAVADVSATIEDFTLKIAHAAFVNGTQYKVTVPANAISQYTGQDISWTFTTLPPFGISSYYPENGATDVDLATAIRVVFNQPIPEGSSLEGITIGGKPITASITSSWNLTNNQVSLNTSELALKEGTEYEVIIPAGSVAGWDKEIKWSFTTYIQLKINAYSPKANALNVARNAEIAVEFNKTVFRPMWGTPPAITIKAGETEVAGISARTEGNKLIIAHADFDYKTEYTVSIPAGNINNWNENIIWKFTTESDELDIIGYTPEQNATNATVRNTVAVDFNRAITLGNTGGITINGEAPTGVVLSSSINDIQNQLKINHANFQQGTEYTVVIPAGAVVGYNKEITWKFKTVEPLVVTKLSPANGAMRVALDAPLTISFSRKPMLPMRPTGFITILGENGTEIGGIERSWNAAGDVLTITHAPFDLEVTYTVTVPASLIIDASDYSQAIVWSFTTTDGTSIKEVSGTAKVYPTLTKGNLTINAEPGTRVKIANLAGQIVAVHQLTGNTLNLNLAHNNGTYIVILENNKGVSTHKIILQK